MNEWQLIETYPKDIDSSTECYWGPEVLVIIPSYESYITIHGVKHTFNTIPARIVARLEADMWLSRHPNDSVSDIELTVLPTHWAPILPLPKE